MASPLTRNALRRAALVTAIVASFLFAGCPTEDCGNGVLDPNEACDDGPSNASSPNACRPYCELPTCGDGVVDDAVSYGCEQCDDGFGGLCGADTDCRMPPDTPCDAMVTTDCCGNGVVDVGEACDDGNSQNLDGCETNCTTTPAQCML